MRFISWNINGIRSLGCDLKNIIQELDGDVICFQEVKIPRNQVDESIAFISDYYSFFAFPRYTSGYSGVATYCRSQLKPSSAYVSLDDKDSCFKSQLFSSNDIKNLENEGRILITRHHFKTSSDKLISLYVFNLYCPRFDPNKPERSIYKLNFHRLIEEKLQSVLDEKESNHILLLSDLNISHKRIDHCEPEDDFEQDPFRQWMDEFLSNSLNKKYHFVDIFRHRYPDAKSMFTCWNSKTGARQTNYGTRIDYAICDSNFLNYIQDCQILFNVLGSDHCPVLVITKNLIPQPNSSLLPALCTQNWPEFGSGKKQTTILNFVVKGNKEPETTDCLKRPNDTQPIEKNKKIKKDIKSYFKQLKECEEDINDNIDNNILFQSYQFDVNEINNHESSVSSSQEAVKKWKSLLQGPPKPPLCSGHQEECKLNRVNKAGPNKGRQFWCCPRPAGFKDDPASSCDFFRWFKK